ncbi:structural cement protein Gp24 [Halovulum sp. GXIMD14793]
MAINDTQLGYSTNAAVGYAGMLAEGQTARDVASKAVEDAAVAFGLAVGAGAADGSVRLGGTGFEGIALADKTRDADQYDVGEMAGVIRKGTVWVEASTNVGPADPVTFTAATGVIGAGLAATIDGAKFETTATAGNLVRVYLG